MDALLDAKERGLSADELAEIVDSGKARGGHAMSPETVQVHIDQLRHVHGKAIVMVYRYRLGRFNRPPTAVLQARERRGT